MKRTFSNFLKNTSGNKCYLLQVYATSKRICVYFLDRPRQHEFLDILSHAVSADNGRLGTDREHPVILLSRLCGLLVHILFFARLIVATAWTFRYEKLYIILRLTFLEISSATRITSFEHD